MFQGGIIVAVDSRASMGTYICTFQPFRVLAAIQAVTPEQSQHQQITVLRSLSDCEEGHRDQPLLAGYNGRRSC